MFTFTHLYTVDTYHEVSFQDRHLIRALESNSKYRTKNNLLYQLNIIGIKYLSFENLELIILILGG